MVKRLLTLAIWCAVSAMATIGTAQIITTSPAMLQATNTDIVITYHADKGNGRLAGLGENIPVYAHTGVITSTSNSDSDWQYAPQWLDNSAKYLLNYVGPNTYTLTIGNIYEYYGISDESTDVKKLMFVFRTADGKLEGKTASNGDIAVEVYPAGYYMELISANGVNVVTDDADYEFVVNTTSASNIEVKVSGPNGEKTMNSDAGVNSYSFLLNFPVGGNYTLQAKAEKSGGSETTRAELNVTRVVEAVAKDYPGGKPVMGAVDNHDGSVTFCIAAPEKSSMMIIGSWDDYAIGDNSSMWVCDYEGQRYFWTTVEGLKMGQDYFYYYLVDGTTAVGDPYARMILDPYNDQWINPSVFPNLPKYPSEVVPYKVPLAWYNSEFEAYDWEVESFKGVPQSQLLIYELLIRDFTGEEGQANASGTVQGVLDKLDYIQSLGVNAVELLPIMEFNGNNSWGYNTNFYFALDKAYGTPDDYRKLIDECHKRGMAVILDIVFNQSDGLHPWYQMYPIASNPFYNGSAPHAYSVLNDWNQDNVLVQQQWKDAVEYWMTAFKVDGFRFDLVKGLGSNASYDASYNEENNTWSNVTDDKTNRYNASRVARMKEIHDAMRLVNADAYFINENLASAQEENEMAKDGETNWANINHPSIQFAKGLQSGSDLNRFYAPLDSRTWGSTVSYAESHDEERLAYAQSKGAQTLIANSPQLAMRYLGSVAAQMLMTPGAHMIWQFQEIGADQTTKEANGGNDTSPKRVIWSYLEDPDHRGLKESYAALGAIRAQHPDLFTEDTKTTVKLGVAEWSSGRYIKLVNEHKELICVVACRPQAASSVRNVFTYAPSEYKLIAHSYECTPSISGTSVVVQPGAFAVYLYTDESGINDVVADSGADIDVAVDGNDILVTGNYQSVNVVDALGRECGRQGLAKGIYVVTIDGRHTTKVAVR